MDKNEIFDMNYDNIRTFSLTASCNLGLKAKHWAKIL